MIRLALGLGVRFTGAVFFGGCVRKGLELTLTVMQRRWDEGDTKGAAELAKRVAPQVRARAAPKGLVDLAGVEDGELGSDTDGEAGGAGIAGEDPG